MRSFHSLMRGDSLSLLLILGEMSPRGSEASFGVNQSSSTKPYLLTTRNQKLIPNS
jgi:hypothetical protein